jgi:hypothetical protein
MFEVEKSNTSTNYNQWKLHSLTFLEPIANYRNIFWYVRSIDQNKGGRNTSNGINKISIDLINRHIFNLYLIQLFLIHYVGDK